MSNAYPRPGAYIVENLGAGSASGLGIPGQATACFAAAYNIGPTQPTFVSSWQHFTALFGGFPVANQNPLHFAVWQYFLNGGSGCFILRVPNTDATSASLQLKDLNNATVFTANANAVGGWGDNIYIEIVPLISSSNANVNFNVYQGGTTSSYLVETFLNVSTNPAAPRYITTIVNSPISGSNYINLTGGITPYVSGQTDFATLTPTALSGGGDGSSAPTMGTAVPNLLDQYLQMQILNLNLPGVTDSTDINNIISWAAGREDVFLIIDGPTPTQGETSSQVVTFYSDLLQGGSAYTLSTFAAIWAPYLLIQDPSSTVPGATRLVPPAGAYLGLQSIADATAGPQQVAAGVSYGVLKCVDLEVRFSPTDLNNLFPTNINAIKLVPYTGFCLFGARTLFQGYPNQYIPIRRVLMKVEHDAIELTQFAMFEPNVPSTWNAIKTVLNAYLITQTNANMFGSTNPAQAFQVTCDSSNNPPALVAAGICNISIALALGSPIEIIVITISQLQTGQVTVTSSSPTQT